MWKEIQIPSLKSKVIGREGRVKRFVIICNYSLPRQAVWPRPLLRRDWPEFLVSDGAAPIYIKYLEYPLQLILWTANFCIFYAHELIKVQSPTIVLVKNVEETVGKNIILNQRSLLKIFSRLSGTFMLICIWTIYINIKEQFELNRKNFTILRLVE